LTAITGPKPNTYCFLSSLIDCHNRPTPTETRYDQVPLRAAEPGWSNTLDIGGDCHTGRLADSSYATAFDPACRLLHRNASYMVVGCPDATDPSRLVRTELPRVMRDTPAATMQRVHGLRRRCNQCSAPPTFETPQGARIMVPETSVTTPFRLSTERVIASELRNELSRALCNESLHGCPHLDQIIHRSRWVPGTFWDSFIGDVRALLDVGSSGADVPDMGTNVEGSTPKGDEYEDDRALWAQAWMYCAQPEVDCKETCDPITYICSEVCDSIHTDQMTCNGVMNREAWLNPATRIKSTIDAFAHSVDGMDDTALSRAMNVCDLDSTLSEFCRKIQTARSQVFSANCHAAGVCFKDVFFYQPSMFSMSNNQFVKQTVEDFYRGVDPRACTAQLDERTIRLAAQNAILVPLCPATTLELFKKFLRYARMQVGSLVRAGYYAAMVVMHALRLMIPGDDASRQDAVNSMGMNTELLFEELGNMLLGMLNLLLGKLLETPSGSFIEQIIIAVCELTNWIMRIFYLGMFCPVKLGIEAILTDIINALGAFMDMSVLIDWRTAMEAVSCDPDKILAECERNLDNRPKPIARIDAPTRCWSTYTNSLGDASSLSCSAADSCVQHDASLGFSDETRLVACDSCPILVDLPDFTRFGCDTVRKQCKCAVQANTHTACINHAQCRGTGSTCDVLDTAFSPSSFGTQPCDTCLSGDAMCVAAPGGARCACTSRKAGFHGCSANAVSSTIVPDPTALCLTTLSLSTKLGAAHSSQYSLQYDDLAAVPCAIVTNSYCYLVFSPSWGVTPLVVGIGMLNTRRRLLQAAGETDEAFSTRRRLLQAGPESQAAGETDEAFSTRRRLLQAAGDGPESPTDKEAEEKVEAEASNALHLLEATVAGILHIAPNDLERVALHPWDKVQDEGCRMVGPLGSMVRPTNLSISDHVLYKQCVRWRAIGDDVCRTFNLTAPDTFLLSMQDLAASLADPMLLSSLLLHPEMVLYTALHSEAAAPIRATIRTVKHWAVHAMTSFVDTTKWIHAQNATNTSTAHEHHHTRKNTRRLHTVHSLRLELMRAAPMQAVHQRPEPPGPMAEDTQEPGQQRPEPPGPMAEDTQEPGQQRPAEDTHESGQQRPRHLLSFQSQLDAVKTYSAQLAVGDGEIVLLGGTLGNAFAGGPVNPLAVSYAELDVEAQCAPAWNLFVLGKRTFDILARYFVNRPDRPTVQRDILLSMPTFTKKYREVAEEGGDTPHRFQQPLHSLAGDTGRFLFETLAGFDANYIRDVIDSIPGIIQGFVRCDIDSVMYCTEFRYSLVSTAIIIAAIFYVGGVVVASLGVPYTWTAIAMLYVPVVLHYSLGYSPLCAPMVPTCIGQEIISSIDLLLPVKIHWPEALQKSPGCIEDRTIQASDCILSCSAHPFSFRGWSEPVAWSICEVSISACDSMHRWLREQSFAKEKGSSLYDLSVALWRSHAILTQTTPDTVTAFRICSFFTSWRAIPVTFMALFGIYVVPLLIVLPIQLILATTNLVFAAVFMSHVHLKED
jgi:hypothetical protein